MNDDSNVVDLDGVRRRLLSRTLARPPCVDCGKPTTHGRWRCDDCQAALPARRPKDETKQ